VAERRVRIVSDGTPRGTAVYVDGKLLPTARILFSIGYQQPGYVWLELSATEAVLELEGPMGELLPAEGEPRVYGPDEWQDAHTMRFEETSGDGPQADA
jgi:hypothetical protein